MSRTLFHNYEIPERLSELYGLNAVTADEMGITSIDGFPLSPQDKNYPCMKSLPMGCSWAVEWSQDSHMELVLASGALAPSQVLTDFRPPARINEDSTVGTLYLDNENFISQSRARVDTARDSAATTLRAAGLPVHEEAEATTFLIGLGLQFDGENLRVSVSS